MQHIHVIGGGVAGIGAALELAKRGHRVTLIEKETLGYGSSGRNPGRMGHGFHYVDVHTALMYLRSSIQVQRHYPGYLIGENESFDNPLRHGRYFITKKSDVNPEDILKTYGIIQKEYERLVKKDSRNEVFGPPSQFYRILETSEYEHFVDPNIVEIGVETCEHLFNFEIFLDDMRRNVRQHQMINLVENTEVTTITHGRPGEPRFRLSTKTTSGTGRVSSHSMWADYVVNSTWQNIEFLNDKVGIRMTPGQRTNRVKCLLVAKLPESLRGANSMFFCMGQHCMFSNMDNGVGMMTFGNVTNMETAQGLQLSGDARRRLDYGATEKEKRKVGQEIIDGVSQYIPAMKQAEIIDVKYGVVQTKGKLSLEGLHDPLNTFHKRDYDGVREEQLGLLSNPCMKLFYFLRNAKKIADLLEANFVASEVENDILKMVLHANKQCRLDVKGEIKQTLRLNFERLNSSGELIKMNNPEKLKYSEVIFQTMKNKNIAENELLNIFTQEL